MPNHDPISDMLTRIRNASEKRHQTTRVPASRMSRSIAKVLQQEGFIAEIVANLLENAFRYSSSSSPIGLYINDEGL